MIYVIFILICIFSVTSAVNGDNCINQTQLSGELSISRFSIFQTIYGYPRIPEDYEVCWLIEVPEGSYVQLNLKDISFGSDASCSSLYLKISVNGGKETYTFCSGDTKPKPIVALNDVIITLYHSASVYEVSSFRLQITTESLICAQKNNFQCSPNFCIHKHQVCNDVKDCENGADEVGCEKGIMTVKGIDDSRIKGINWLKNKRTQSFGWGKNTHRAITALYLAKAMTFQGNDLEEELIATQLELRTSVALLRNASDPISINELSMFVNALTVTCHNPRHFYGYDLVQILSDRVNSSISPEPTAYLTLCNLNWTLSDSDIKNLMTLLQKNLRYPFQLDVRALTVMAVTCVRNKMENFRNNENAESIYNSTIQNFSSQLPDGSFGNVYTTALVTQALISSGQEESRQWNATAAAEYLMKQLDSPSVDFLSVYLTLPILSGRSLVDIQNVDCSKKIRKEDKEISEVTDKLGGKIQIQYSLYIGDQKDVVHTIYLRMPENSSAYDVMKLAQIADSKYKFLYRDMSGEMYIYEIAGIINDPEDAKFWLLYTSDQYVNGTVEHHAESPDKFILGENDHLIMWYRTTHM